jgi:hypothetical protein
MLKRIEEINLPSYATLSNATINDPDMGEKTIETTVKIDGNIAPDFSYDWMIKRNGHHYIQPLREPQAKKENTSTKSTLTLTFQHWAIWKLQQKYFFQYAAIDSGTAVPDKYKASVSLNLGEFVDYYAQVLNYWYGDSITIDLNPEWIYDEEAIFVSISYSTMWEILSKLSDDDMYGVRWELVPTEDSTDDNPKYVIKVGYDSEEINHIFEYGFEGGLLSVERQVQSSDIHNVVLGRGGDTNLPNRYFKDVDEDNPSFPADPDWIPELRNIYFSELRGKTFRDYVKGWKTNPNRQLTEIDGTAITPYGSDTPIEVEEFDEDYAAKSWAYLRGHTDEKFDPVEYVADAYEVQDGEVVVTEGSSIDKYGEIMGAIEADEDIYPTIQQIDSADHLDFFGEDIGRVDQTIYIEQVLTDDIVDAAEGDAVLTDLGSIQVTTKNVAAGVTREITTIGGQVLTVGENETVTLTGTVGGFARKQTASGTYDKDYYATGEAQITKYVITAINRETGETHTANAIPTGSWNIQVTFTVVNYSSETLYITASLNDIQAASSTAVDKWTNKFEIWIKNIWGSEKQSGETDLEYANRIWDPIMGDRWGNEAKVVFSTGLLSTSEDYEFVMLKVEHDDSKTLEIKDKNGKVTATYQSEWKLTLAKSDADYDSLGVYIPSVERQGEAGDYFFFTGIDMPHAYVLWAEENVDINKEDELDDTANIKPTWVVSIDKVRANTLSIQQQESFALLIDAIKPGATFKLSDKRFISGSYEQLYVQSLTTTYSEGKILPELEITLSDEPSLVSNSVSLMQSEIDSINRQLGSLSKVEQIIRSIGDKLYLRKDGVEDLSISPTKFASFIKHSDFRQGAIGGKGWAIYQNENGQWVLEIDTLNVRQDFNVNNLVINQISVIGGKEISSAAQMTVTHVVENADGYVCYFDTKCGSVSNLFNVDDVALSEVFNPDNQREKYYKRKVIAVGVDNITLSKDIANGSGVPEKDDVIAHYGSYTNEQRRFVKVRDVIGGGYERYIEGLDSVDADGTEYYFVGKQDGDTYRIFIGHKEGNYLEWTPNGLNIKGNILAQSTIGEYPITKYLANENLILNSDKHNTAGTGINTYTLSKELTIGETYTLSIWYDGLIATDYNASLGSLFKPWLGEVSKVSEGFYQLTFVMSDYQDGETDKTRLNIQALKSTFLLINKIKLEVGAVGTEWSAAPTDINDTLSGFDYLTEALKQNTVVDGGLILASLLKMGSGNTVNTDGTVTQAKTYSGINGVYEDDNSPVLWGGGDMKDRESNPDDEDAATFMVRMNGTAYFCNNLIRLLEDAMMLGENLRISETGLSLLNDQGNECFRLSNEAIPSVSDYYANNNVVINDWRSLTGTVYYNDGLCFVVLDDAAQTKTIDMESGTRLNVGVNISFKAPQAPSGLFGMPRFAIKAIFKSGDSEVEIIDTTVSAQYNSTSKSYYVTNNISYNATVGGTVTITVEAIGQAATEGISQEATTVDLRFDGGVATSYTPMVQIFNNGFVAANSNTVVYSGSDAALLRYGEFGIKLSDEGIQITNTAFDRAYTFNFNTGGFE